MRPHLLPLLLALVLALPLTASAAGEFDDVVGEEKLSYFWYRQDVRGEVGLDGDAVVLRDPRGYVFYASGALKETLRGHVGETLRVEGYLAFGRKIHMHLTQVWLPSGTIRIGDLAGSNVARDADTRGGTPASNASGSGSTGGAQGAGMAR